MESPVNAAEDTKSEILRQQGVLHARPRDVTDLLFTTHEFFDPRDRVQLKYEMLRRVEVEGHSVSKAAALFGFSRPAFYRAQTAYRRHGLPGLIPQRPGPRRAHKLSGEILDFVRQHQAREPTLRATALSVLIQEVFGQTIHPRSIERALTQRRKKGRSIVPRTSSPACSDPQSPGAQGTKICVSRSWNQGLPPTTEAGAVFC
jgi:transposase